MEQPTLIIMAGAPGSGKTSFAERLRDTQFPQALLLSADDIRFTMSFGGPFKSAAERYVRGVTENYVRGSLIYGRSCIADSTNLTISKRAQLVWWAREYGSRVECYYIKVTIDESARRSAKWIPKKAILSLFGTLEEPTMEEDFDKFITIDSMDNWKVVRVESKKEDLVP